MPVWCLVREKDQRQRIGDIAVALFVIDKAAAVPGPLDARPGSGAASGMRAVLTWQHFAMLLSGIAATAFVTAAVVWFALRPGPVRVTRLMITPSNAAAPSINSLDRDLAITPEGSRIVYIGNNGTQLFVRALDALEPVAIYKGAPREPFVSPDGQWVGFVDANTTLKKVAITGGPAVTLARLDSAGPRGATWAPDETIIFATLNATTGLQRVPASGGTPVVLTRPDRAQGEFDHNWPENAANHTARPDTLERT